MRGLVAVRLLRRGRVGAGVSVLALGGLTAGLAPFLGDERLVDVALLYLLFTLVASGIWGYRVGLATAVMANLLLNYFFVPPLHTLAVQQPENVVSLLVFLAVAVVGASMLAMLRTQIEAAVAGRAEVAVLLDVGQAVARAPTPEDALRELCATVVARLGVQRCLVLHNGGEWRLAAASDTLTTAIGRSESQGAEAAARSGSVTRLADEARTFVPFPDGAVDPGVLVLVGRIRTPPRVDRERLLHALAAEAAVALNRVQLADEARRAAKLERNDTLKATLLTSVSHDLRSPLTAVKAAISGLRDPEMHWSTADTEHFLATIETQTDRLTNVVSDLLELARLDAGGAPVAFERIEVSLLLGDVVRAARPATEGRPVVVDARGGLWTRADYRLLMQALGNLVENAARYSVPGGTIYLGAELAEDRVLISVRDEGPGIPEGDLPHVFERLYRGVQGRKSRGTGLGLALAKAMLELSGGSISVRSSLRGTVFSVNLPAATAP